MWINPLIILCMCLQVSEVSNGIHLPSTPVLVEPDNPAPVPQPEPNPTPSVISKLKLNQWYVIESSVPITVLSSPEEVVSVESSTGPIKVRGEFVDGNGKVEIRTYNQPYVVFVSAIKSGNTELIIIPEGFKLKEDIVRQKLTVSGVGPNPPPTPDPVDPVDPTPVPVSTFRVIFVKESGQTLPIGQSAVPGAKSIRDYLATKTTPEGGLVGWREYDPDQLVVNEQPIMKSLWDTVKPKLLPTPCMVIEVNGKATLMPFPKSVDNCLETLKKYGGV